MRFTIAALIILLATPVMAKDMTITLNDEEQKALLALIDAGVKATGLSGVPAAARVVGKMQAAMQPPPAATPTAPPVPH